MSHSRQLKIGSKPSPSTTIHLKLNARHIGDQSSEYVSPVDGFFDRSERIAAT
jgi:hypothetical protein